ncbi:hypothetical protein KIN20_037521 [Parelaphostrongylus tenuis]|uniref:Uncharacterized protein n=1 Tax=Parelaphostrongylus tenuis TaxID=148309 RepID=A0AAD5RER4_PARTN|nr:hypothetical protein KIN20_037521 [Parelaphostrongylus tenuis]
MSGGANVPRWCRGSTRSRLCQDSTYLHPITIVASRAFYTPPPDYDSPRDKTTSNSRKPEVSDDFTCSDGFVVKNDYSLHRTSVHLPVSRKISDSTRSYIRQVGIPVLPPITPRCSDHKGSFLEANKAFLRHLENHRIFDTVKTLRNREDCQICYLMSHSEPPCERISKQKREETEVKTPTPMQQLTSYTCHM